MVVTVIIVISIIEPMYNYPCSRPKPYLLPWSAFDSDVPS